jgi:hypothetical protein
MAEQVPKKCFLISPLGPADSPTRIAADFFREDIVRAALAVEFEVKRADDYNQAGNITSQVIQAIASADLIVADLTKKNANVYYELGVAHSYKRHVVPVKNGDDDPEVLPFDNYTERTLFYSMKTVELRNSAKEVLKKMVQETLSRPVSNPVTTALGLEKAAADGDDSKLLIANVADQVASLNRQVELLTNLWSNSMGSPVGPEPVRNVLTGVFSKPTTTGPRNSLADLHLWTSMQKARDLKLGDMFAPREDDGGEDPPDER